jgi:hypothetical protein
LKQEWQKSPALGQANRRQKLGLVWINRKKISQILNAYLFLPFFRLIILCILQKHSRPNKDDIFSVAGSPGKGEKREGQQQQAPAATSTPLSPPNSNLR